jgi:hypothetical protein
MVAPFAKEETSKANDKIQKAIFLKQPTSVRRVERLIKLA